MKNKFSIAASLAVMLAMLVTSVALAAVWTEQYGYPYFVMVIRGDNSGGAGYLTGETVQVDMSGPYGYTATCNGVVLNEDGEWSCQVPLNQLAGGEYTYTTTGLSSNVSESGTFTNAVHYESNLDIVGLTPTTVSPGGTITWSAAASCFGPLLCIPVPDAYSITLFEFSGIGCSGAATVVSSGSGSNTGNLTFSAPSTPGNYSFRAQHSTQTIGSNQWLSHTAPQCSSIRVTASPQVGALTLGNASSVACVGGNSVTLDFSFGDSSVRGYPWHVVIDWGDGTQDEYDTFTQGAQPQASHSYTAGTYTVSVNVTNRYGDTGSNSSAPGEVSFLYNTSGILQPVTGSQGSFKIGSTIPVKLQVTDCNGDPVSGLPLTIYLEKLDNTAITANELVSTSAADSGTTMRFTGAPDNLYIFNMSTKRSQFNLGEDLTTGTYHIWITDVGIATADAYFDAMK